MRFVFTGATMPAVIRRFVASPENEPPSYSPDCIRETPLFESVISLALTLQPVFSSNGVTQSKFSSTRPSCRRCYTRRAASIRPRPSPGTSGWSSLVLLHLAPVSDGELVLSLPDEADSLAFLSERLGRGRREVLLSDDQLR